jgi:hypothetical protein
MTKTRPRSFSSTGKVSRGALTAAAALVALSAVTAVVVARAGTASPASVAEEAGHRVLGAVEAWQSENPTGCPSLTVLRDAGYLSSDARTDDPWGGRFRIVCDTSAASVLSAGPDGRFGTKDDVSIGH